MVSAGFAHAVLLRSDGCAVAIGRNRFGQCDVPALDEGMTYTQISAKPAEISVYLIPSSKAGLLRSDGSAVAIGDNEREQRNIPALYSEPECCVVPVHCLRWQQNTPRFLQALLILYFSGVMAALLPSEAMGMDNATSPLWMRGAHTPTLLLAVLILCFSEVMAVLLLLEETEMDNATSRIWMRG